MLLGSRSLPTYHGVFIVMTIVGLPHCEVTCWEIASLVWLVCSVGRTPTTTMPMLPIS